MHFIVSPKDKNTLLEVELFTKADYKSTVAVDTRWTTGSYLITAPKSNPLPKKLDDPDASLWVSNYDWKLINSVDPVSVSISVDRATNISVQEEKELDLLELMIENEDSYLDVLHESDWHAVSKDVIIEGPVLAEPIKL